MPSQMTYHGNPRGIDGSVLTEERKDDKMFGRWQL